MTTSLDERREFFRVRDHLFVEFRQIDPEESLALKKNLQNSGSMSEPALGQFEPWASNKAFGKDDIYTYLEMLDRKLNMVIDLLSARDHPFHGSYMKMRRGKLIDRWNAHQASDLQFRLVPANSQKFREVAGGYP